jgi:hypothetical protein
MPSPGDSHAVGAAAQRLSGGARRSGKAPLLMVAALLDEGEAVRAVIQGRFREVDGIAALTDTRILLVNAREWDPDVVSVPVTSSLAVQGWQDDRVAALVFTDGEASHTIDRIPDRPLAIEFAQLIRGLTQT